MPRLSRAESQARTREKLLATAKTCFLRDGFAATSLEGIADVAGFSKGAVYSNFKNKNELCLAVLDSIRRERAQSLAVAMVGADTLDARIHALEAWAERHVGDRAWTTLEVEVAVHATHDPKLVKEIARRHQAFRQGMVDLVRAQAMAHGIELPLPAEDVAIALLSLGIGLGVQRAIDPTLSVGTLGKAVRFFATERVRTTERAEARTIRAEPAPKRSKKARD